MKLFRSCHFRQILSIALIVCTVSLLQAQTSYLCNEKFSAKNPSGWSIAPTFSITAPSWKTDTGVVTSAKYAMHGYVPFTAGDTTELVTPFFDCSKYTHVLIRFSHICKVLPSDICEVQYQEQGLGTYFRWKNLPKETYLGSCSDYKTKLNFSHDSYLEWGSNDTLAKPNSGWYKQETFDISDYASLSIVRFRFIIRKGSYLSSYITAGWYVDDFQLLVSQSDIRPPVVEFLHSPKDTVYSTGPFNIRAKVASRSAAKIVQPYLSYTGIYEGVSRTDSIKMNAVAGDSIWTAVIPQHKYRTDISYSIYARDANKNSSRESGHCYLKLGGYGTTDLDSLTYGNTSGAGNSATPLNSSGSGYNWSKVLYTANTVDPKQSGKSISGIAFYTYSSPAVASGYTRRDKIFLKATSLSTLKGQNVQTIDPANEGAILVFDGEYQAVQGWVHIRFDRTFYLNPGENLLLYRVDTGANACNSTRLFYCYNTVHYTAQEYSYTTLSCAATSNAYSSQTNLPTTRFYFGKNEYYDSNSVAMASIDYPGKGSVAGKQAVRISLRNKGEKDLQSAKVHWMVNGVLQTAKNYTGQLPCDFSDTLTLGTYTQKLNAYDTITVWVSSPNGKVDSYTKDDTLRLISYGCDSLMHGAYTIGKNDSIHRYDFANIDAALNRMRSCGISGDINLKLASGVYTDNLDYTNFEGLDGHCLIISSLAEQADSVIYRPQSGDVLTLDNSRNIHFRNITLDADYAAHSHCVYLGAGCSNVAFRHCKLIGWLHSKTNSGTYSTVYKASGGIVDHISFIGNEILGGSYGIYLYGHSASMKNHHILFDSNYISRSYGYAFYGFYNRITFSHNIVEESSETYETYHGVYNSYSDSSVFDGNRIHTYSYANDHYGLCFAYADSSTLVCNNEIIMKNNNALGGDYGMFFSTPEGVKVINNSLLMSGPVMHYGVYAAISSVSYMVTLYNNICVTEGGSINYPLFFTSNNYLNNCLIDYNCLWSSSGTVSYAGGSLMSLPAHVNVFPTAIHDVFQRPIFADTAADLNLKNAIGLSCPRFRNVNYDIEGKQRIAYTSMGAYSEAIPQQNTALTEILNWPGTSSTKDTICPSVVLVNKGLQTLTDATLRISINEKIQGKDIIWKGKLQAGESDTLSLGCFYPKFGFTTLSVCLSSSVKDSFPEDDTVEAVTYACSGMLSGSFTVGKGGFFSSMTEAVKILNHCGINGPVTLQILPDTLLENIVLNGITGISATNTLSICSSTGDSTSVLWMRADDATLNTLSERSAPLVLDGISHVRIHHLSLSGEAPMSSDSNAYSHGIVITGKSSDVEIHHCVLSVPSAVAEAQSGTRHNAVCLNGNGIRDVRIHHNLVKGGSNAFFLNGTTDLPLTSHIHISDNRIESVDFSVLYSRYADSLDFIGNSAVQRRGNFTPATAQVVFAEHTNANFSGNTFDFASVHYGLYVRDFGTGSHCSFTNNEMRGNFTGQTGYGVFVDQNVQLNLYHNSFAFGSETADGFGLYLDTSVKALNVKNNIFCMLSQEENTWPIYVGDTAWLGHAVFDYNCHSNAYPQNAHIGYVGIDLNTLQAWKAAVSSDKGSVSLNPHFKYFDINMELLDSTGISCPAVAGVTDDILNRQRGSKTNMGAYHFSPCALDLALDGLISPSTWETSGKSIAVKVRLTNTGTGSITSARIAYTFNGVNGSTLQWTGKLDFLDTVSVVLGNIRPQSGINTLSVYCFNTNNGKDEDQRNDSLYTELFGCDSVMSGIFSVGGPKSNYRDLNEALNALQHCGMDGPVTLNVVSGTYASVNIDGFNSSTAQHLLTIRSAAAHRDSVVFEAPIACQLNNVSHLVLEDVSFKADSVGVKMSGYLENVAFHHCLISSRAGATSSGCRAVDYTNTSASTDFLNDVRFIGNDIRGGYYNMFFHYAAGNSTHVSKGGLTIDSNSLTDAYAYGVYNNQYSHIESFSHNSIRNASNAGAYYAYYAYYYSQVGKIVGNRIRVKTNNYGYGFYFSIFQSYSGYSTQTATLANNEIILLGNGVKSGIHFLFNSGRWNVCNNSIYVNGTGNSDCLYNNNSSSTGKVNIHNNLLVMDCSTGYPFYIAASAYVTPDYGNRDYNCYVNLDGGDIAFLGAAKSDLTSIKQMHAQQDQHSISATPIWENTALNALNIKNVQQFSCPTVDEAKADIDGFPRGKLTCMGCYGIKPDSVDVALLGFVGAEEAMAAGNQAVKVVLSNMGFSPLDTATISLYINGTLAAKTGYRPTRPLAYDERDTVLMGNFNFHIGKYRFRACVQTDGDANPSNDTIFYERQICGNPFAGKVIIGNSARAAYGIQELDTLWSDMAACGVSGDVTLAIESGKYSLSSSVDLSILLKIMNGHRLTLTSEAGNRDSVYITGTATSLFDLRSNRHVTIRDLSLENMAGNIIYFSGPCYDIDILYNRLSSSTSTTSSDVNPIQKPIKTGILDSLRIIGNLVSGGYCNIHVYGENSSSFNHHITIDSNTCTDAYYYGIYVYDNDIISLSHNRITCRTSGSYSSYSGLYSFQNNINYLLSNDVDVSMGTNVNSSNPVNMSFTNNSIQSPALIANNVIKGKTTGAYSGFYTNTGRILFYHNSVYMGGTGAMRALYSNSTAAYPAAFIGNQLITEASGYPLYSASSLAGSAVFDYNNYYSGGSNIAYYGRNIANVGTLQNYTGSDTHSVSVPVQYVDLSKSQRLTDFIGMTMPRLKDVGTDCEDNLRDVMTAMGAYEPLVQKLDAALTDFGKTVVSVSGKTMAEVTLLNYGKDTLTSVDIEWSINGVARKTVPWKGSLPMFSRTVVRLDSIQAVAGKMFYLTAWVSKPNNGSDMNNVNDTISMSEYACNGTLDGTYYVGGNNADFATLKDAVDAIYTCGVGNPVILKVRSGKYGGLEIKGKVYGSDKYNTITVMADNNASVIIDGGADKASLSLNGASFWTFKDLTIGNIFNATTGILFKQTNKEIHFRGCNIYASTGNTASNCRCVDFSNTEKSGYYLDNVTFIRNNLRGGYYNIYLYCMGSDNGNLPICSITIDSNTFRDAYYCGIYSYYYAHFKSISYNRITNRKNGGLFYGIYNIYYQNIDRLECNHIHIDNNAGAYGIYLSNYINYNGNNGKPGKLCNNEIIVNGIGGSKFGIYFYLPYQQWEISHNSVFVSSTTGAVYGLYAYNTSQTNRTIIKNNLLTTSGTATNYPISLSSYGSTVYVNMDYNNYFALNSGSPSQIIGYASMLINSLATWKANTGEDAHSTNNRPFFKDSTINLELLDYHPFVCPKLSTVANDINGKTRTSTTSMGAQGADIYEGINLKVVEFVNPKPIDNVVCYADYTPVSVAITNEGLKNADFSASALKISLDVSGASSWHCDTTITLGTLDYMQVDTISLGRIPTMASGTYRIKVSLNDTADKVFKDDTLSLIHNAYRVELPYDADFSVTPAEFVNVNLSGETGWKVVNGSGSNPALSPVFGNGQLLFAGGKAPGDCANAIFNAVNIHDCLHPMLSFWYAHNAACTASDMMVVLVTTDGGANYTEVKRILATDTATAWKQYDIDLTAFNQSSCLSVVFRAISYGGSDQAIDRIRIRSDKDASLKLLPIDITGRTACDRTPVDVRAVLTNRTLMSIDLPDDTLTLNVTGAVHTTSKYVYNKKLGGLENDTVILGQIDLSVNGNIYLEAYMQSFDDNAANDTIHDSTLYIMQDIALDSIIGIDAQAYRMSGEKVNIKAVAINNGNVNIDRVRFRMILNGNEVVTDTVHSPMKPGDTLIHAMNRPYTVPAVSKDQPFYFLEVRVDLGCDGNSGNDSIAIVGNVNIPDSIDLQVLDISATSPAKGKTKIAPSVRIANIGNQEASDIKLHVDVIDSSNSVVASLSETVNHLNINETKDVVFTMNYTVPDYTGQYTLKAYVETYNGDTVQGNDTLNKVFACEVHNIGIRERETLDWSLGQNIPNPANNNTRIPFSLPQDGTVVFSVMSVSGQLIYREQISAEAGDNSVSFDVSNLAAGIYYYSMEYNGQRIVRKMNVTR